MIFKFLHNNLPQNKLIHLKIQCVLPICFCLKAEKNTSESFTSITHASCLYVIKSVRLSTSEAWLLSKLDPSFHTYYQEETQNTLYSSKAA